MALNDVPFQGVAEDLVVPLQLATDSDNRYILKLVEFATQYPEAVYLHTVTLLRKVTSCCKP